MPTIAVRAGHSTGYFDKEQSFSAGLIAFVFGWAILNIIVLPVVAVALAALIWHLRLECRQALIAGCPVAH